MSPRLGDDEVYRRLTGLVGELRALADQCWSPASATALRTAAAIVERVAAALLHR